METVLQVLSPAHSYRNSKAFVRQTFVELLMWVPSPWFPVEMLWRDCAAARSYPPTLSDPVGNSPVKCVAVDGVM